MQLYFFRKIKDPDSTAFRPVALYHNVRISQTFAIITSVVGLILCIINQYTNTAHVLLYPHEYAAAITFICVASLACYFAFHICKKINDGIRDKAHKFLTNFYALIILISSLWITFVMQHNPSNTMSIFVLGILSVASLWIFEEIQAITLALLILVFFDGGLHYFQTDPCKLFTNYITGTLVSVFFVCISRICFSINYNHFRQLKKIERHEQDLIRVNEMQTEILTVVAHDLKAPINNVLLLTDLLKNADSTIEEKNEHYDLILKTCRISYDIIETLLNNARNDESDTSLVCTCMNDFIEDAVHQFVKFKNTTRAISKNASREIIFNRPGEKIYALINHQKITRVFDNLLSNAWKFTKKNGIITIDLKKDGDNICILVTDNGIGIPQDMLPVLFNRFSKAGRTGLNGEKSHGLGMSICKLFMKQHHGDISAHSEEGNGTEITITLPVAQNVVEPYVTSSLATYV